MHGLKYRLYASTHTSCALNQGLQKRVQIENGGICMRIHTCGLYLGLPEIPRCACLMVKERVVGLPRFVHITRLRVYVV